MAVAASLISVPFASRSQIKEEKIKELLLQIQPGARWSEIGDCPKLEDRHERAVTAVHTVAAEAI